MAIALRRRVECYADPRTVMSLKKRFGYCFEQPPGSAYPAILNLHRLTSPMRVGSIDVTPFQQDHGETFSLGFRFGPIGYSNDASALSDTAFAALAGVKVWIVDAMRREPHPSHAHLDLTLSWIARLRPQRAILTNMHNTMDYATLRRDLPSDIEPAYDGMVIEA
jgi:phosphoribosyl 1,2-cyclic phosphate phosphodiesterase